MSVLRLMNLRYRFADRVCERRGHSWEPLTEFMSDWRRCRRCHMTEAPLRKGA